jgi:hypothetical protein
MIEFYGVKDVYSENGTDLTLLRENLELSVELRWKNNIQALLFGEVLHAAAAAPDLPTSAPPSCGEDQFTMVLRRLVNAGAEFALLGGIAQAIHGQEDCLTFLSICYRATRDNALNIGRALAPFAPRVRTTANYLVRFEAGADGMMAAREAPGKLI